MSSAATAVVSASSSLRGCEGPGVLPERKTLAPRWLRAGRWALLIVLPLACYWPALRGPCLWDDDLLVFANPLLRSATGLWRIWFSTAPYDYFPLTNSAFWLEWHLWGAGPLGYHLVNVALHVVSALLLWRCLGLMRVPGAWVAAILFAIHPINAASVAWISELKNVLSGLFYFACLVCWLQADGAAEPRFRRRNHVAALLLFVLAALSKSSVVMLPCVLLLLAWWRRGRIGRRDLLRASPFFVVSLGAGLTTIWFQYHRTMTAESLAKAAAWPERFLTAARAVWFYVGKILFPHPLVMLYPPWEVRTGDLLAYLAPLALAAAGVAAWFTRKSGRGPGLVIGYFLLTVLPISGLLHMSFFKYANVSDHLVYLATPAICAAVAALLHRWQADSGFGRRTASIAAFAVVAALSLTCFVRSGDFSSSERLWTSTLAVNPDSFAAHNHLGLVCLQAGWSEPGKLTVAEAHFRRAMEIDPKLTTAGVNLASVLRMEGRQRELLDLYPRILAVDPDPEIYNNYGVALLETGDQAKARETFVTAAHLQPLLPDPWYNLAGIARDRGRGEETFAMLHACLRADPNYVPAVTMLGTLYLEQPAQGAVSASEVVKMAERVCFLTADRGAPQLILLARAQYAASRRTEAMVTAQKARKVAVANSDSTSVQTLEELARGWNH